jgi:hypothetical protein
MYNSDEDPLSISPLRITARKKEEKHGRGGVDSLNGIGVGGQCNRRGFVRNVVHLLWY